jgi:hypothetical protein
MRDSTTKLSVSYGAGFVSPSGTSWTPARAALALGVISANGSGFCIHPPSPSRRGSFSIFRAVASWLAVEGVWGRLFWRRPCPNERR